MGQSFDIKKLVFVFLLILPTIAFSQEKSPFDEIEYVGADKVAKKTAIIPDKLVYLRLGKALYSNTNLNSNMGSLGIKATYDKVSTGFEHSNHVVGGIRINDYNLTLGYRPEVEINVKPGIMVGAGLATETKTNQSGLKIGIGYFYDFNLELMKKVYFGYDVILSGGLKSSTYLIPGKENQKTNDLYLSFGIGW